MVSSCNMQCMVMSLSLSYLDTRTCFGPSLQLLLRRKDGLVSLRCWRRLLEQGVIRINGRHR